MSRQVTVRVPISRPAESTPAAAEYLAASFTVDASRERVVERGGALLHSSIPLEADPTLVGFRAACAEVGRSAPEGARIRVVSRVVQTAHESSEALLAGAVGARALLDLALDDGALIALVAALDGGDRERVGRLFAAHAVVSQETCDP